MQHFQVRLVLRLIAGSVKYVSSPLQQLPLPLRYLRRMDLVLLGELSERLIATQCRYCHFGFEAA